MFLIYNYFDRKALIFLLPVIYCTGNAGLGFILEAKCISNVVLAYKPRTSDTMSFRWKDKQTSIFNERVTEVFCGSTFYQTKPGIGNSLLLNLINSQTGIKNKDGRLKIK